MSPKIDYQQIAQQFTTDGYAIIEDFFDQSTIDELKMEKISLVSDFKHDEVDGPPVFHTGAEQKSNKYFLESADKIRYFLEKDAIDYEGRFTVPKERSLNKIGHALHWLNPIYRKFTFDQKFKDLAKALKLIEPVVVQSMIIFKNPRIGGEVVEHQDASYLHTEPSPDGAVVGFWIPLEDATLINGCLEFVPGSHKTVPLPTRWIRNVDPFTGDIRMLHTNPEFKYGGDFTAAPAKAGSCVIINGLAVHRSAQNKSDYPRPIYTFHMFDQASGKTWDKLNWLQPTEELPFPSLYDN